MNRMQLARLLVLAAVAVVAAQACRNSPPSSPELARRAPVAGQIHSATAQPVAETAKDANSGVATPRQPAGHVAGGPPAIQPQADSGWYDFGPEALREIIGIKQLELLRLRQIVQKLCSTQVSAKALEFTGSFSEDEAALAQLERARAQGITSLMIERTPFGATVRVDFNSVDSPGLRELQEDMADLQRAIDDAEGELRQSGQE